MTIDNLIEAQKVLKKELLRFIRKHKEVPSNSKTLMIGGGYVDCFKEMVQNSEIKVRYAVYDETGDFVNVVKKEEGYIDENTNVVFKENEVAKLYSLNKLRLC